jgi:hypothetical protein
MHTTCFDQNWSPSSVSKIADETAVLPSANSAVHDTIQGTSRHHRPQVRIDEGISQKLNLRAEIHQFRQQFFRHLKMANVGRNI